MTVKLPDYNSHKLSWSSFRSVDAEFLVTMLRPLPRLHHHHHRPVKVNFINIRSKAFTCKDPKSAKKTDSLTVCFALFESAWTKAASTM